MKKYLAFDGINGGHEDFDTIEEARKWLEECFLDDQEGYHPDFASCMIFQLAETIECDVVDKKENYKYIHEEDVPDDEEGEEVWPYGAGVDEIWKHRFVPVSSELLQQRDELKEALTELVHLHGCEQEGIGSGQPTPQQWYDAVNKAEAAIKNTEKK